MSGFITFTILANILVAIRAECCKCDCQQNPYVVAGQFYHPVPVPVYAGGGQHIPVALVAPQQQQILQNPVGHEEHLTENQQILQNSVSHEEVQSGSEEHDYAVLKKHKDHNVHYKYEYSVNDEKTHDIKKHEEERKGDVVKGQYSLLEPDGNVRTVKYYADWKNGFHAQVLNSKKHQHK